MSIGSVDAANVVAAPRRPIFLKSLAVVLAWNVVPTIEVAVIAAGLAEDRPGCVDTCAFQALALFYLGALLLISLVLGLVILAVLAGLSRRRPRLRRVAMVGNLAAIPGMALTAMEVLGLITALRQH